MRVYRVTEVIGTSTESWEHAARSAVETAAAGKTPRAILGELAKLPIEAIPTGLPVVELAERLGCSDLRSTVRCMRCRSADW